MVGHGRYDGGCCGDGEILQHFFQMFECSVESEENSSMFSLLLSRKDSRVLVFLLPL